MSIPREREDQKLLLRGLMNVRVPKKINPRFLQIQDEYLRAEMEEKNILFKEKNQLFYRRRMAKIQQLKEAIEEADAVIFIVDARTGVTPQDHRIAQTLRESGRKI